MKRLLLIPRIKVHNANALSSPYTIGFPAMTAWLGAVHALERQLRNKGFSELRFPRMAVVCHQIDLQTYKGPGDYVQSIIGTSNPLDKAGKRPSFIEEARCHLDVSLLIEFDGIDIDDLDELLPLLSSILHANLKIAGGDIFGFDQPAEEVIADDKGLRRLLRKLMPGHCLIERRELMQEAMKDGQDAIDALLDHLKVTHDCEQGADGEVAWSSHRKEAGWIVPVATGFHGVSELGQAMSQRDPDTPHRFAESVVTLGEFVMPYRISNLDEMLWHYSEDLENNLYLCVQNTSF